MEVAANEVNEKAEELMKDMRKERRERKQIVQHSDLQYTEPSCSL